MKYIQSKKNESFLSKFCWASNARGVSRKTSMFVIVDSGKDKTSKPPRTVRFG